MSSGRSKSQKCWCCGKRMKHTADTRCYGCGHHVCVSCCGVSPDTADGWLPREKWHHNNRGIHGKKPKHNQAELERRKG